MKERYCTYSQAVKLKELGFDGVDKYYVTESFCINNNPDDCYSKGQLVDEYIVYFTNENNEDDYRGVPAPRLDQAAAWLREVKGIDIDITLYRSIDTTGNPHEIKRSYEIRLITGEDYPLDGGVRFPTYELALSAGIAAALELLTDKLNNSIQ